MAWHLRKTAEINAYIFVSIPLIPCFWTFLWPWHFDYKDLSQQGKCFARYGNGAPVNAVTSTQLQPINWGFQE